MDSIATILAFVLGLILIILVGRLFIIPIKIVFKLLLNGIIGGLAIVIINIIGKAFMFSIPLNIFSALITGTLGVPGVILLIVLKLILK